jgi:branched-chain amino acid aminotransferase
VVKADDQLELEIQDLTPYDIYTADECFATATSTGVRAITHLNSSQIGDSDASPITEKINEKLREHLIATGTPIE